MRGTIDRLARGRDVHLPAPDRAVLGIEHLSTNVIPTFSSTRVDPLGSGSEPGCPFGARMGIVTLQDIRPGRAPGRPDAPITPSDLGADDVRVTVAAPVRNTR